MRSGDARLANNGARLAENDAAVGIVRPVAIGKRRASMCVCVLGSFGRFRDKQKTQVRSRCLLPNHNQHLHPNRRLTSLIRVSCNITSTPSSWDVAMTRHQPQAGQSRTSPDRADLGQAANVELPCPHARYTLVPLPCRLGSSVPTEYGADASHTATHCAPPLDGGQPATSGKEGYPARRSRQPCLASSSRRWRVKLERTVPPPRE